MLNVKFAEAYVDLVLNTRKYYADLRAVQASLARIPGTHTVTINVNRAAATSNINLFMQQLRSAQALTRFQLQVARPGGFGFGRGGGGSGGMGGGGFMTGLGHGLGLPFATNPQMMAGQMVGGAVQGSVGTAAGLQTQVAELRRVAGLNAAAAQAYKESVLAASTVQAGVSVNDLMEISQIGGRAGVADREGPQGLLTFTKDLAMVKNAVADMPTEELASSIIKVLNVFDLGTDRVASFGSALTAMDNVSVASAKDILDITTRLSGTAQAIGLTLPQVTAFSSVLKDVGLSNEVAGSSFSQIFRKMATDSRKFAAEMGVDAKTFADAYRRDPMEALGMVIERFHEMRDTIEGQEFLAGLGLRGVRVTGSLQQLASKFELVEKRAKIASAETGSLNALMTANALKSDTLEASWVKLKNAMTGLSDAMGNQFLPVAADATNALTGITKALSQGDFDILTRLLSISVGPEWNAQGQNRAERRQAMEDWFMKNVLGTSPSAGPAAGAGGNPLPAGPRPFVGPPAPAEVDIRAQIRQVLGAISQAPVRTSDFISALAQTGQGVGGVAAKGLGLLGDMKQPPPQFATGLSGEDVGRRIQEDILNANNRATEETAKNTARANLLLIELRDAIKQGGQNIGAAVLGQ
jgi:TP901 family phage tail tape measure protein